LSAGGGCIPGGEPRSAGDGSKPRESRATRGHSGATRFHEEAGRTRLAWHYVAERVWRTGRTRLLRVSAEREALLGRRPATRQGNRGDRQDLDQGRIGEAQAGIPAEDPECGDRVRDRLLRA